MTIMAYEGPCGRCGATENVRLYLTGRRCPECTPARLAGRPEPETARACAPLRCYCGECPSWRPEHGGQHAPVHDPG